MEDLTSKYVQYYVEGEDEKKLINVLKTDLGVIQSGKVQKLNVVECEIPNSRLTALKYETIVVLVFDTDTGHVDILNKNIKKLEECPAVSEIVTIPQVQNLEQELVRSCNIKRAVDLLGSKSEKEFKSDFVRVTNLARKLKDHQFDIKKLWSESPPHPYHNIDNKSERIKRIDGC